jgi:Zn-dependent protease
VRRNPAGSASEGEFEARGTSAESGPSQALLLGEPTIDSMTSDTRPPSPATPVPTRPGGFRLGRVLGVPVYLRYSWVLLAVVVVILYAGVIDRMLPQLSQVGQYAFAVGFVLCLLLSVLLHEIGHALVARHYGIGVRAITLELLGGYTEMESDSPHPRADLLVSIVGPIVSGVLGGAALAAWFVLPSGTVINQLAFQLAWSNLIVAVFNSLPGLPLDGGRALRAIVWSITGNRHTGSAVAGWIGRGVAAAVFVLGLVLAAFRGYDVVTLAFVVLVAMTMWQGATVAIAQGRVAARLPRLNLRQISRPVVTVPSGTPLAEANRVLIQSAVPEAALAVTDSAGRVVALVHDEAAAAVPIERRPWVPVDSVARSVEPGRTLAADLTGEDVIRAVQANPAPTYLVVSGTDVVGVLRFADLARVLNS